MEEDGGGGERYREIRKEYNKRIEEKKKEENDKWMEKARKAKTEGQVWEVVNRERKKRKGIRKEKGSVGK